MQQEPRLALDGGADGLRFYETIIRRAHQYLKPEGFLFFEIGDGQAAAVKALIEKNPFYRNISLYPDHTQTDRVVSAQKDEHTWKS